MACELDNQYLCDYYSGPNTYKHPIIEQSREYIHFIINHSCIEHVEDSQEYKYVEHNRVMLSVFIFFSHTVSILLFMDKVWTIAYCDKQNCNLE